MTSIPANLGLIALFPLLGSVLAYTVGCKERNSAGWIATIAAVFSFVWVVQLVLGLPDGAVYHDAIFTWISVGSLNVDFLLRFDHLTAVMCLVVTGVGSLIHLYSIAYMAEDEGRHRFFAYLNLFMFSMLLLVLGGNMLVLFVGWEGVGLCSYLLIGFWFKNLAYAAAGRKAFVVNRIGDAGFLLAMFLCLNAFGTIDFAQLGDQIRASAGETQLLTAIALLLFVGATGKSAQIPLFVWLPDAMAGPTPVSALIHAATMVTAGVYMMARMHFLYALAPLALMVVSVVAVLTAFVAATTAVAQNDIKKVLAYSTVSQLGFMFMAAGAGAYWVAVFHLVTHAFFKACLFLSAGSVIHGCHHEQDMRHMGGLRKYMPITFLTYTISTIAIAGIFPFAGYQSKHAILQAMSSMHNPFIAAATGEFLVTMATLTAGLTAFYMARSVALTFFGTYRGHAHPHESPALMTIPLAVLALLGVGGGLVLSPLLPEYLGSVLPVEHAHGEGIAEALSHTVHHLMGSWVGILGVLLGFGVFVFAPAIASRVSGAFPVITRTFSGKYYFDELYAAIVIRPLEKLSFVLWKAVDQLLIDGVVNGVAGVCGIGGEVVRISQSGQVRHYAFGIVLGAVFILTFYFVM